MLFVEYPKCSTCKKAKHYLQTLGIEFEDRNIKEVNPTAAELSEWIARSGLDVKRFFNTSGLVYKALGFKEEQWENLVKS